MPPYQHPNLPAFAEPIATGIPNTNAENESFRPGAPSIAWYQFFQSLPGVGKAQAPIQPHVVGSPFTYIAPTSGAILLNGGTVSAATLTRGRVTLAIPTSGFIPVTQGDVLGLTFTVAPALAFFPS